VYKTKSLISKMKPSKIYSCEICKKYYKNRQHLYRHKISCQKKVSFHCELCKKLFTRKDSLKHEKTCIGKVDVVEKSCKICNKEFPFAWNLNRHMIQKHTKKEINKCNNCGKAYTRKSLLKLHILKCNGLLLRPKIKSNKTAEVEAPHNLDNIVSLSLINDYFADDYFADLSEVPTMLTDYKLCKNLGEPCESLSQSVTSPNGYLFGDELIDDDPLDEELIDFDLLDGDIPDNDAVVPTFSAIIKLFSSYYFQCNPYCPS